MCNTGSKSSQSLETIALLQALLYFSGFGDIFLIIHYPFQGSRGIEDRKGIELIISSPSRMRPFSLHGLCSPETGPDGALGMWLIFEVEHLGVFFPHQVLAVHGL